MWRQQCSRLAPALQAGFWGCGHRSAKMMSTSMTSSSGYELHAFRPGSQLQLKSQACAFRVPQMAGAAQFGSGRRTVPPPPPSLRLPLTPDPSSLPPTSRSSSQVRVSARALCPHAPPHFTHLAAPSLLDGCSWPPYRARCELRGVDTWGSRASSCFCFPYRCSSASTSLAHYPRYLAPRASGSPSSESSRSSHPRCDGGPPFIRCCVHGNLIHFHSKQGDTPRSGIKPARSAPPPRKRAGGNSRRPRLARECSQTCLTSQHRPAVRQRAFAP